MGIVKYNSFQTKTPCDLSSNIVITEDKPISAIMTVVIFDSFLFWTFKMRMNSGVPIPIIKITKNTQIYGLKSMPSRKLI